MHERTTLSQCRRLTNCRGAVFLLTVYFTALMLLVLGGIALQRTMIETRSTQLSRDGAQAFYLAEAALDQALVRAGGESLAEGQAYGVSGAPLSDGRASFQLQTVSGEIPSPLRQELVRRIVASGQSGDYGTAALAAYVQEQGPVEGIWVNGLIITNGGSAFRDVFLKGAVRSYRGAIATILARPAVDPTAGLSNHALVMSGGALASDQGALERQFVSRELLSLKQGYRYLNRDPPPDTFSAGGRDPDDWVGPVTYQGTDYPGMSYVHPDRAYQTALPHVEGMASLGAVKRLDPASLPPKLLARFEQHPIWSMLASQYGGSGVCNGEIPMTDEYANVIRDGYFGFPDGQHLVMDLDPDPNHITLCVKAIYPESTKIFVQALQNNLPNLRFEKPATVYVTGTHHYDIRADVDKYAQRVWGRVSSFGFQPDWDLAVVGRISGDVDLIMTDQPTYRKDAEGNDLRVSSFSTFSSAGEDSFSESWVKDWFAMNSPLSMERLWMGKSPWDWRTGRPYSDGAATCSSHGGCKRVRLNPVVWIKPGQGFSGSVYAPESLVLFTERNAADRYDAQGNFLPIKIRYLVGNEAVIQLNEDKAEFGGQMTDSTSRLPEITKFLGWMDGPSSSESETAVQHTPSRDIVP